ncbi:MAG: class I SAM-dependent methyltransferase [Chloroflexota bacterium]
MGLRDRALAALYDRMTAPAERRWLGEARRHLLGGLAGRVLEIGAGTGANFRYYPPHVQVTAIEPSSHFLRRAKLKLAEAQATIELRQADAQALPFGDDAFDAAVATLVFCTVPDPLRALAEVRRVTVAGAPLLLIEHVRARTAGRRLMQNVWNPCQKILAGGCQVNRDTEATVRAAGFRVEEVEELAVEWGLMPSILVRATNGKDGRAPAFQRPQR